MRIEQGDSLYAQGRVSGSKKRVKRLTEFELLSKLVAVKYRKFTLVLDEVDTLLSVDRSRGWQVFRKLRGLSDAFQARIILVGFMELYRSMGDNQFPFYGRLDPMPLPNLDKESTAKLLVDPLEELGVLFPRKSDVCASVYHQTGGMPAIVQRLGQRLVSALDANDDRESRVEVKQMLVETVIREIVPLQDITHLFNEGMGPLEQLMVYFAAPPGVFKLDGFLDFLRSEKGKSLSIARVENALDSLWLANIFQEFVRHKVYGFSVPAFRSHILEYLETLGKGATGSLLDAL